ncbi:MAG: inositol phosphate phosphatase SopB [Endozoicomonas sp.]
MKITGPSHDERLMQKESFAALQAVAEEPREPVTLKIGGKEFRCNVHYQILTFSIGVNDLAVKTTGKLLGARSGSSSRNEEAMSLLFGDGQKAGMFDRQLAKLPDSEKEQALKLARCVQSFYDSDIQSKSPSEAFRLAETLVALAYKVNIVPYWFCKSGTDRTLELAISIRRLCCDQAYGLSPESLLQYPHPYSKECTKTMSVLCGVPELQGSNRGTSGFKSLTLQNQLGPILSHESEYKPAMIP